MVRRFVWFSFAAAALSGPALADGTGLIDKPPSEEEQAGIRDFCEVKRQKLEPDRLPASVRRAALEAVPGLRFDEAYRMRHRPITYFNMHTEFSLKGRDATGHEVTVRTDENGGHPSTTRSVKLPSIPGSVIAEAKPYAAKHGYSLTSALVVTRNERVLLWNSEHITYYLKGTRLDRPGVERLVWLSSQGRFRLRDLDGLMLTTVLTD